MNHILIVLFHIYCGGAARLRHKTHNNVLLSRPTLRTAAPMLTQTQNSNPIKSHLLKNLNESDDQPAANFPAHLLGAHLQEHLHILQHREPGQDSLLWDGLGQNRTIFNTTATTTTNGTLFPRLHISRLRALQRAQAQSRLQGFILLSERRRLVQVLRSSLCI